jgi:hypothetical protein
VHTIFAETCKNAAREVTMLFDRRSRVVACLVLSLLCVRTSHAQCHTWSTEFGQDLVGVGTVYALQSFDDGSGPVLWVGGEFSLAGGTGTREVARWNGHTWLATPSVDDTVLCFAVHNDSTSQSLYVGGYFDQAILRWSGSTWMGVGGGLAGGPSPPTVNALASFDAGSGAELYAGGAAFYPPGFAGKAIARWNGQFWLPLGSGLASGDSVGPVVFSLHTFDDGTGMALYVAGHFAMAGGVAVNGLARWNGAQWSAVGSNASDVHAFATFDDGSGPALYATGTFQLPGGGHTSIARWTGSTWIEIAFQAGGPALAVCDDGNGPALFAPTGIGPIAKWNGHVVTALGAGVNGNVLAMGVFDEGAGRGPELFAGGQFTQAGGGIDSVGIAKWISCDSSIEPFCPGDLTLASCPCQNFGQAARGCDNSLATGGAQLSASGATTPDSLVLTSSHELPTALSIFLQGNAETPFVEPFGDGLRCIGGQLLRLYVKGALNGTAIAPRLGDPSISTRSASLGDPISPGSLRYYQVYYRDPSPTFCPSSTGGTFNVSNGMRIAW